MKHRNLLYSIGIIGALVFLVTTSYGALFFASIVGTLVVAGLLAALVGVFSAYERIGNAFGRAWHAVVPTHITNVRFRQ